MPTLPIPTPSDSGGADGTDGTSTSGHGPPSSSFEFALGDVPLCQLNELTEEVEAFIYQYYPLRRYFNAPYPPAGGWMASPDECWPQTPELNTLYWPTGCTRWGFGVFLFTGEFLSKVETAVASGSALLKIGDPSDEDHYIEAEVIPLCPVPVTGNSSESNDTDGYPLYLLPVVCSRYGAQLDFSTAGFNSSHLDIGDTFPMASIFQDAQSHIGGGITFHANALPDYAEWADQKSLTHIIPNNYNTGVQVANAAAWSLGLTLVMELDGSGGFMHRDASTANDTNASRLNQLRSKIADGTFRIVAGYVSGGDSQASLASILKPSIPSSLVMYVAAAADQVEGDNFTISSSKEFRVQSADILGVQCLGQPWTIVSPIIRDVDREDDGTPTPGGGTAHDDDACTQLATDLANEWYLQVANPIDVTFADICNVPLSSHTDIVEWHFGRRGPQTRVRSRRWNAFPNRLINQFKSQVEDNQAPHRFERVTTVGGQGLSGQVKWNGKTYDAEYPRTPDGFLHFEDGTSVIAGWEPIQRKFWICDQQDLDLDFIAENTANWMRDNGWIDDTAGGGDADGGGL